MNITEYFNKMQQDGLAMLKQSQDANIAALENYRTMSRELADKPGTMPSFDHLPTPTQYVEMSFDFAAQVLEMRKTYALKMAEMIAEGQKQAESTMKQAESTMKQAETTVKDAVASASNGNYTAPKPVAARR